MNLFKDRRWLYAVLSAAALTFLVSFVPVGSETIRYSGNLAEAEELYAKPHLYDEGDVLCAAGQALPSCIEVELTEYGWPLVQRVVSQHQDTAAEFAAAWPWGFFSLQNFSFWLVVALLTTWAAKRI